MLEWRRNEVMNNAGRDRGVPQRPGGQLGGRGTRRKNSSEAQGDKRLSSLVKSYRPIVSKSRAAPPGHRRRIAASYCHMDASYGQTVHILRNYGTNSCSSALESLLGRWQDPRSADFVPKPVRLCGTLPGTTLRDSTRQRAAPHPDPEAAGLNSGMATRGSSVQCVRSVNTLRTDEDGVSRGVARFTNRPSQRANRPGRSC
jgi:hypothetical protein